MVSCNLAHYVGTGGATGVAQFMPDTWIGYQERIADVVGKKNPDTWNAKDSVVAMALKLFDVPNIMSQITSAETNVAKMYLSGSTSRKYNWYANKILYWAENYHRFFV